MYELWMSVEWGTFFQFKGSKSFGALNYSDIQMNRTLTTFFSLFFNSFINLVHTSEGTLPRLLRAKGLELFWNTHVGTHGWVFLYTYSHFIHILSLLFRTSTRLSGCCPVGVTVMPQRALFYFIFNFSVPSDLCSSFWLTWRAARRLKAGV